MRNKNSAAPYLVVADLERLGSIVVVLQDEVSVGHETLFRITVSPMTMRHEIGLFFGGLVRLMSVS